MNIKETASKIALECLRRNKNDLSELEVLEEYLKLIEVFETELNIRKQESISDFDVI